MSRALRFSLNMFRQQGREGEFQHGHSLWGW
jgi:hypothetical protein